MTSNASQLPPQDRTLALSVRDVQYLTALEVLGCTLLNPSVTDEQFAWNIDALEHLFVMHYSAHEGNALRDRLRALLPLDTVLELVDVRLAHVASTTSYVA